jgi:GNAT superfamily N-acetyltransferase
MSVKSVMAFLHEGPCFRRHGRLLILAGMTQPAKSSFVIRAAKPCDAVAMCEVLRRSIIELCVRDHQNDPRRLAEWLANKTPEHVAGWIADPATRMFVAAAGRTILAVGSVRTSGEILLNYVSPDGRLQGISRAMLDTLERTARANGCCRVTLTSTFTAHDFYLGAGYNDYKREAWEGRDWPLMEKILVPKND